MTIPKVRLKRLVKNGEYSKAVLLFDSLSEKSDAEQLLGSLAHIGLKQYKQALDLLLPIYSKDQANHLITFLLAQVYENLEDYDSASYFYSNCLKYKEFREEARDALRELRSLQEVDSERELIKNLKPFKSDIAFKDVMGLQKQKTYLTNHVVTAIKDPELLKKYGKKRGTGVLFYGPPGTGKTYLSKAIAGEVRTYMLIGRISDLIGEYMGITEKNIKQVFRQARLNSPCVIFFDEIDALGAKRESFGGSDQHGGTGALKIAVSQFLTEMQGIESSPEGLFVIAATNSPWSMDAALKRSGRLSDTLYVGPPSYVERIASFRYNLRKVPQRKINFERVARASIDFSQADINQICDEVSLLGVLTEKKTKKTHYATTNDVLKVIKRMPNTLDEWFANTRKQIIGKRKVELVDGKKVISWIPGILEPEEKRLYKDLIRDIRRRRNPIYRLNRGMQRLVAFKIW